MSSGFKMVDMYEVLNPGHSSARQCLRLIPTQFLVDYDSRTRVQGPPLSDFEKCCASITPFPLNDDDHV